MFRQFIIQVQNQFMRYLFIVKQTQWNSFRDIIGIIEFSHHAVSYLGQLLRIYKITSHPFTSLFPINMIFECLRLVPFSGLCTQQLYNSVNYFLKKTHLAIKWPSFFPLSRKYGGVKVSKHQQTFRVWSWFPCRCNIRSDHTNDVPLYFSSAWNASPYKLI